MSHAWLDSLSEDWVSQPGSSSDSSQAALPEPPKPCATPKKTATRNLPSRIPRFSSPWNKPPRTPQTKPKLPALDTTVLSERSNSENNISPLQDTPSKAPRGLRSSRGPRGSKNPGRGRLVSQAFSAASSSAASSNGSIVHNTVDHKSQSGSPANNMDDLPEWKRRLVYGYLSYGESKDLFSSAATGLENIFRPPEPPRLPRIQNREEESEYMGGETTMSSSPPPQPSASASETQQTRRQMDAHEHPFDEPSIQQPAAAAPAGPAPKSTRFKRNDDYSDSSSSRSNYSTVEKTAEYTNTATGTHEPTNSSFTSISAKQRLEASRKTSNQTGPRTGQSTMKNEDISLILISRHNGKDGQVSYAPTDVPAQQLRKRLENLKRKQTANSDLGPPASAIIDESEIFEDTDEFARNGGFLNLRRGGRSDDGSFHKRPLSPPTALPTDISEMLPESSIQASTPKQLPTFKTERYVSDEKKMRSVSPPSPALPRAPHPSPEKRPHLSQSGSPLKLFGPYDTFTNQTLLRRISQFEDQMESSPRDKEDESLPFPSQESPTKSFRTSQTRRQTSTGLKRFGAGGLDGFEFSEDVSIYPGDQLHADDKENMSPPVDRTTTDPKKVDLGPRPSSADESLVIRRRRNRSGGVAASPRPRRPTSKSPFNLGHRHSLQATPKRQISECKRPWTSPGKDPTPKRRRTLHRSDVAYGLDGEPDVIDSIRGPRHFMQSILEKRRIDSEEYDIYDDTPDIPVPVSRQGLRPRSKASNHRATKSRERNPLAEISTSQAVAPEVISREEDGSEIIVRDFATEGSRRPSIKTQDFFEAAEEIMAMIRSKARPKVSLDNVDESEEEGGSERRHSIESEETDDSYQESSKEPLSRPPSRDGAPVPRQLARQEDPEILSRLKQYEEGSDFGNMNDFLRSIRQEMEEDNQDAETASHAERPHSVSDDSFLEQPEVISDLSNVRISRNPDAPNNLRNDTASPTMESRSSGSSAAQSYPTTSSRGTDSMRLIGPDAVTELIGDQVGDMVFDKQRKIWKKVKATRTASSARASPSEESDDEDPFANIPDLTVDTAKETATLGHTPLASGEPSRRDSIFSDSSVESQSVAEATTGSPCLSKSAFARLKQDMAETALEDDEEIEHEISIHEDRVQEVASRRKNLTISFSSPIASFIRDTTSRQGTSRRGSKEDTDPAKKPVGTTKSEPVRRGRYLRTRRSMGEPLAQSRSRSRSRGLSRNLSVKREPFVPRPVSRIEEQDEVSQEGASPKDRQLSIREDSSLASPQRNDNFSIVLSTPAPDRNGLPEDNPKIAQYVGTFSLSPLSEFTINHGDRSCALEVSYVVGDQYLVTGGRPPKKVLSKALRTLVEKITEVEPFEPDWDSMRELDIHDKQLTTLHKLDEFCTNIVTLNASHNAIGSLGGVPDSVRNLRATHCQLSELTAWGHLMNLQYVDVSNNNLSSLYAFKDLVHLRQLRADNNQITDLGGIQRHDSLQVLRARNNRLSRVDLDGTLLRRLTELDLEGNEIRAVEHLDQLPCLATLNLQRNWLGAFEPGRLDSLRYLKLSDNDITALDLSAFPALRLLHVDRNRITALTGFARCRRLDTLSLREQQQLRPDDYYDNLAEGELPYLDTSFLAAACEVRKLFLSGNRLAPTFVLPAVDFLNLQLLEAANCGVAALGAGFGELVPNLRALNLSCNALADLGPLRGAGARLKRLLVAGNRLADARALAAALAGFPHLSRLDARDNPATLGFYPPPSVYSGMQARALAASASAAGTAEHEDEEDFAASGSAAGAGAVHHHGGSGSVFNKGEGAGDGGGGGAGSDPFALPDAPDGGDYDRKFQGRLDMGTRMRRRLYEAVVLGRCRRLRVLDGLAVARGAGAGVLQQRDAVWDALVQSGVVTATGSASGSAHGSARG